ncbi:MAG: hypothetical protein ACPL7B_16110, partial [Candidatus Poribacteria bacterium]
MSYGSTLQAIIFKNALLDERKISVMSITIRKLNEKLTMKVAEDKTDIEKIAEFDGNVFDERVSSLCIQLFLNHPNTSINDLIFIENEKGEVVSSLCLIPWEWDYDGIILKVGELGIVGTAEK